MSELTAEQRNAEIRTAIGQLMKLGGAALSQGQSGNTTGYGKIQEQIVQVGERLEKKGGIPLVDSVYSQLERQASGSMVREITLAWKGGLSGWTI